MTHHKRLEEDKPVIDFDKPVIDFDNLSLSKVSLYSNLSVAPIGRLVRFGTSEMETVLGLCCEVEAVPKPAQCVLILDGEKIGTLFEAVNYAGSVLNVTDLCEVVAINPCPFILDFSKIVPGTLFCYGGSTFVVWSKMNNGTTGYVSVSGVHPDFPKVGSYKRGIRPDMLTVVSQKVGIRVRAV